MSVYTKHYLTEGSGGAGIILTGNAIPGQLIHNAINASNSLDEVWIFANNPTTGNINTSLQFGGTTSGQLIVSSVVPKDGLTTLCPGLIIGSGNAIRAFSEISGVNIFGFVNRIS